MTMHTRLWWNGADPLERILEQEDAAREEATHDRARAAFEADLDVAAGDVQSAHFAYEEALRRYRCAPHGTVSNRRCDLRMANARILKAELAYADVRKREPRG